VGSQPRSLVPSNTTGNRIRIALSTDSNDYECRVSLGKATIGRKVVAPCGCTGSQEVLHYVDTYTHVYFKYENVILVGAIFRIKSYASS
jgi:hypothetical protein